MGLPLIADAWLANPANWLIVLEVAFGLGMVIFVHELGHFAVAKWCGVKVEKFYLGFDIYGWKLWKFRRGETEYGIGVLPLGGYVKMLGQDDNPGRVAEETARARLDGAPAGGPAQGATPSSAPAFDPRSYMAKSVPQRMAIISAGVVMNLFFAFIVSAIAYGMGVPYMPCVVSGLTPGDPAWQAGLRPGDEIVRVEGVEKPRFDADLMAHVMLADLDQGVSLDIQRPGHPDVFTVHVKPRKATAGDRPTIGVLPPRTTQLPPHEPVQPHSQAARSRPGFQGGDEIVRVDGQPVSTYAELQAVLARNPAKPLTFSVRRSAPEGDPASTAPTPGGPRLISIRVDPAPLSDLGLVMKMGKITAVQADSPAARAQPQKLAANDTILEIDGQPPGDPMTLAERLRRRAGQTVKITVSRPGEARPIGITVTPRDPGWYDIPLREQSPVSAPAVGIAFEVQNRVAQVQRGRPAAKAGLKPGDSIVRAVFQPAGEQQRAREKELGLPFEIEFRDGDREKLNYPFLHWRLQNSLPDTKVLLETSDGRGSVLEPSPSSSWFHPERGFWFVPMRRVRQAESFSEAVNLGARETKEASFKVYWIILRLGSGQLPLSMVGGPGSIAAFGGAFASAGVPQFLLFLALLSANLAVLNFLPIPLLDGGHIVFLAVEGIRGKPVSEKVLVPFLYLGLVVILGLVGLGLTNDVRAFLEWIGVLGD